MPPPFPTFPSRSNKLAYYLQQIRSKAFLFTTCQTGQAPQNPPSVFLVCGNALVVAGHCFVLCSILGRLCKLRVQVSLVLDPTFVAVASHCVVLVLSALFVPIALF